mgnify:CR=1 FL=1
MVVVIIENEGSRTSHVAMYENIMKKINEDMTSLLSTCKHRCDSYWIINYI